ncbi:hypothetical protein L6452_06095 [Arctium lappa]|uniref:Uncharacterized protein n=1 Tax=Arctium lappa TaxID=4217 RepID=A0ACB9EIH0_ARCLA|nr:hypothetical protein L6452_06095 [Arctium lappa]
MSKMEVRRETIVWPDMRSSTFLHDHVVAGDRAEDGAHRRFYGTLLSPEMEVMRETIIWPEMESSEVLRDQVSYEVASDMRNQKNSSSMLSMVHRR